MSQLHVAARLGKLAWSLRQWPSVLWRWEARFKGVEIQGKLRLYGRPIISVAPGSRLVLGEGVGIASSPRENPLGLFQPSVLRTLAAGARLILGPEVGISGTVICAALSVEVGEGTIMGSGAMIIDTDFHQPEGEWRWGSDPGKGARPVRIGRGAFIGARAIVLKGVTIGDRAVVGAGAVVTRDVPANHIAAGNPAQARAPKAKQA